jgi:hypothetical protein
VRFSASRPIVLWLAWLVVPALGAAQKPSVIPLVPAADWRLVNSAPAELQAVRKWDGDPIIEREYGVKSLERRKYQLGNKSVEVLVEEASDASSAYGLFTFYQTVAAAPEKGMQLTASDAAATLMARGRYFIRVARPRTPGAQLSRNDFRALLIFIGGTRPAVDAQANLPAAFPASGLVPGSEKYIVGPEAAQRVLKAFPTDLIGFSQGAELQEAAYLSGKERATLLAITYPTPQIARVRFGAMERFLGINEERGAGSLYGKREASFVFLVLGASSPAFATRLMDQFKVVQSVDRNERYPDKEPIVVQLMKFVLTNLLLVGIAMGFTILGGALIFLSRRLAARWFPTSHWGHPDEDSIIRLNLS